MMAVRVAIRVGPGASRTKVGGAHGEALVVKVAARAVEGKATEAALRAVADALGVRRRDVRLISGATSREKLIEVDGDERALTEKINALRGS
ncbi:protein of unknown function DUF167 [Thermomonospora curvata DSM 43183]|uniref:UPF0235 protein Tcur_2915 n=3 Tax=Thermomonospora TaxID=2019 RepID=D1A7T5_THECD|nr:protein of unknown function DUF167 [Thermomonospora curvata DSM 43183]PKK13606.1 MAG: hypothetical protein BUE48_014200 [Thermomonospora sp. CIF 1]